MIFDSVKEKYNLTVNSSMTSYFRDKLGICVKKKDGRYNPTQKTREYLVQNNIKQSLM